MALRPTVAGSLLLSVVANILCYSFKLSYIIKMSNFYFVYPYSVSEFAMPTKRSNVMSDSKYKILPEASE